MNSLNILSALGSTPPSSPSRSRAASQSAISEKSKGFVTDDAQSGDTVRLGEKEDVAAMGTGADTVSNGHGASAPVDDEKTPLLGSPTPETFGDARESGWWFVPKRVAAAAVGTLRVVLTAITTPVRMVVACFYDDQGRFSALLPVFELRRVFSRKRRRATAQASGLSTAQDSKGDPPAHSSRRDSQARSGQPRKASRLPSFGSDSTAVTSESEFETERTRHVKPDDSPSRHTRSKSIPRSVAEQTVPAKRSIRIKLNNEEGLKRFKEQKNQGGSTSKQSSSSPASAAAMAAAALKSPTSPGASIKDTRYPRAPAPPRLLVPRRQPSYSNNIETPVGSQQKTLILDLDETLIHSMSKGGRYTTGHMVEVKMQQPIGIGNVTLAPQVPVLYFVHKRPHCDEFLRKVCKWYNLVVFTASVQEYADPVIDWLELERKYFAGRLYRQHCTYRNGAYVKDLGQVEPDLSKVAIIDNSPTSYMFHEDNAIPIEGWISDPTDNDLLHLIPLLEGLQYATDVRTVLALRLGQPQTA